MNLLREGGSGSRPPLVDGTNWPYWKAKIRAFIRALDEKGWRAIQTSWTHPIKTDDARKTILKHDETCLSNDFVESARRGPFYFYALWVFLCHQH